MSQTRTEVTRLDHQTSRSGNQAPTTTQRGWVWLDVSATCNLTCELCYTTAMRAKQKMTMATFQSVVDRLLSSSTNFVRFHLNWRGEPTSNPCLPEMIRYLSLCDPALAIEWHTNGTLISLRQAEKLIGASDGQLIYVSLDGGTADSFEATRGRGTWGRALCGLETLLRARGERSKPSIGVYQLDLGVAREDYDPRFLALLDRVDVHTVVPPIEADGGSVGSTTAVPRAPCFWLGNALAIDCHGNAFTCLLATATLLGSLLDTDVDELFDRAQSLRNIVTVGGRRVLTGCRHCRKAAGSADQPTKD